MARLRQERFPLTEDGLGEKQRIVKPISSAERAVRKRVSTGGILLHAWLDQTTRREIVSILFNSQSWEKKRERMEATLWLTAFYELWSIKTMGRLGVRVVDCVCGPNIGHNAWKPSPAQAGR